RQHHRHPDPVHADVKLDPELFRPEVLLLELVPALLPVEGEEQDERPEERDAGEERRQLADEQRPAVRHEGRRQHGGSHERGEQDDAQQVALGHRRAPPPPNPSPLEGEGEGGGVFASTRTAFTTDPCSTRSTSFCTDPLIMSRNGAGYRPIHSTITLSAAAMPHSRGCRSRRGAWGPGADGPKKARS